MNSLVIRAAGENVPFDIAKEVRIQFVDGAEAKRDEVIRRAQSITGIATPEQAQAAADIIRELRDITKAVESSRTEIKAPVLDLGKRIDATAKLFVEPINPVLHAVDRQLSVYLTEQDRKRREAEAARLKAEQEARDRERKAQEEAQAALRKAEQEAEAAKAQATEEADPFAEAEAEAARQQAAADAQRRVEQARAQNAEKLKATTVATAAAIAPQRPTGTQRRREPRVEIHDLLWLASVRPELVTITPKMAEILAVIRKEGHFEGKKPMFAKDADGASPATAWWEERTVVA